MDVLEGARRELLEFLDRVWSVFWESLRTGWSAESGIAGWNEFEKWEERQTPGRATIQLAGKRSVRLYLYAYDPRRWVDGSTLGLELQLDASNEKGLLKLDAHARDALTPLAEGIGLRLDWSRPMRLWSTDIAVSRDSAENAGRDLAAGTVQVLRFVATFDAWVADR